MIGCQPAGQKVRQVGSAFAMMQLGHVPLETAACLFGNHVSFIAICVVQ